MKKGLLKSVVGIIISAVLIINTSAVTVFADVDLGGGTIPTSDLQAAAASTPTPATSTAPAAPSMEKFDVSTYLKLKDAQSYLSSEAKQNVALGQFIVNIISILTKIIGSFALLVIIVGGITIMISTGNQGLQTKGKEMIKFALIGLVIAFMSLIIVTFVQSLFYTR